MGGKGFSAIVGRFGHGGAAFFFAGIVLAAICSSQSAACGPPKMRHAVKITSSVFAAWPFCPRFFLAQDGGNHGRRQLKPRDAHALEYFQGNRIQSFAEAC